MSHDSDASSSGYLVFLNDNVGGYCANDGAGAFDPASHDCDASVTALF
jgi:hypothetical protein